jgi:hypothetical protein
MLWTMLWRVPTAVLMVAIFAGAALVQSKDDVAVYDAALAHLALEEAQRNHSSLRKYLIFDETTVVLARDIGVAGRNVPQQLIEELLEKNTIPQSIANYSVPNPHQLSSAKMLGPILKPVPARGHGYDFDALHARFRDVDGVLELSVPAYSRDGNTALLYFWTGCGMLCATGYLCLLEKSSGQWHVVTVTTPWMA